MKLTEFRINFDMPIRGSNIQIPMSANVELHHSEPYYILRSIAIIPKPGNDAGTAFIKELRIKQVKDGHESIWVHCDTGRESDLSRSAGMAIEEHPSHTV